MNCPLNCVSCEAGVEDIDHVFFHCPFAMQVWQRSGLWHLFQQALLQSTTTVEAIFQLLHDLASNNSRRFAVTIWSLWKHRNLKLWNNTPETMAQVVDRAVRMLEDWKPANNISSNAHAVHDRNNSNDPQVSAGLGHNYHAAPAVMSDSDSNQMRWQPPDMVE